jgi:hypothetical protein
MAAAQRGSFDPGCYTRTGVAMLWTVNNIMRANDNTYTLCLRACIVQARVQGFTGVRRGQEGVYDVFFFFFLSMYEPKYH